MIPQITSALSSGFTSRQVVDFLLKQFPQYSSKIKGALAAGYSADHVLKFLSGGKKALAQEEFPTATTEYEQTRSRDIQNSENRNRIANVVGAGAVMAPMAASALSTAMPAARTALSRAAPQLMGPGAIPGAMQPNSPPIPEPMAPNNEMQMPNQQQAMPQSAVNPLSAVDVLQKNKFTEKVDSLLKSGNTAEQVDQFYRELNPTTITQIEKEAGKPFKEVVDEYIQTKAPQQPPEEMPPEIGGQEPPKPKYPPAPKGGGLLSRKAITESFDNAPSPTNSVDSGSKLVDKVAKGQIVETPDGIGEVREIRNGKALVEVDGKMRKVLEEELMSPGIPQKDLAELHEDLIEGIKTHTGKNVSRHVELAGYDSIHKEMIYKPWSGETYTFKNIDPEDVEMLTSVLTKRKTSGENHIGAWEADTDSPIGAAISQLVDKLRQKSKESGNQKAHTRKYETVYSAYEPAQKASKKKKDDKRKRIRDEKKKRKAQEKQALQHSRSASRIS